MIRIYIHFLFDMLPSEYIGLVVKQYKQICEELVTGVHRLHEDLTATGLEGEKLETALVLYCFRTLDEKLFELDGCLDMDIVRQMFGLGIEDRICNGIALTPEMQAFVDANTLLCDAKKQLVDCVIETVRNPAIEFQYTKGTTLIQAILAMVSAYIGIVTAARSAMKEGLVDLIDNVIKSTHGPVQYAVELKQASSEHNGVDSLVLCIMALVISGEVLHYQRAKAEDAGKGAAKQCLVYMTGKLQELENRYQDALREYGKLAATLSCK